MVAPLAARQPRRGFPVFGASKCMFFTTGADLWVRLSLLEEAMQAGEVVGGRSYGVVGDALCTARSYKRCSSRLGALQAAR